MNTYEDLIQSKPVVLVEFYATWCPHCRRMEPIVKDLKELLDGRADVYQLDIDRNEDICNREEITSTPTFIIYRDGREVWRYSGEANGNTLLEKVESFL